MENQIKGEENPSGSGTRTDAPSVRRRVNANSVLKRGGRERKGIEEREKGFIYYGDI